LLLERASFRYPSPSAASPRLVLERIAIAWNIVEAVIAIGAGMVAGSIALVGFGLDGIGIRNPSETRMREVAD